MKEFNKIAIVITFILSFSTTLKAQETNEQTKISIEIDPSTFVFSGYSMHVRIQPKGLNHILVGAGLYSMNLPTPFVDLNKKNKSKNWNVRINRGLSLFSEYHFNKVHQKWFVGTQIGVQEFEIEKTFYSDKNTFNNLLTMMYLGYTFTPFNNKFYLKPWTGLGYTTKISGHNTLLNATYHIAPITMFATLHIGYTF